MSARSKQEEIDRFRKYLDAAWNEGDLDALGELFAEDAVVHETPAGRSYEGLYEIKEWVANMREGFPDFTTESSDGDFVVGETKVVSQWVARGTHEGRLPGLGVEPTNESVEFEGITVYELKDGKVTEAWWYFDMLGFLGQLGLAPEGMPT